MFWWVNHGKPFLTTSHRQATLLLSFTFLFASILALKHAGKRWRITLNRGKFGREEWYEYIGGFWLVWVHTFLQFVNHLGFQVGFRTRSRHISTGCVAGYLGGQKKTTDCMGHWPCGILVLSWSSLMCYFFMFLLHGALASVATSEPQQNSMKTPRNKHISVGEIPTLLVTDLILSNISPWYPINYNCI